MCGRYALAGDWSEFTAQFDLEEIPGWTPRYNIAPSAGPGFEVPIFLPQGIEFARFWYIPSWWKEPIAKLPTSFNARGETVFQKPLFKGATRCLIPTSGWREFPGERGHKRAFVFHQPAQNENAAPSTASSSGARPPGEAGFFAFCGIASHFTDPRTKKEATSFSIVTQEPNDVVRPYHNRMPVIVPKSHYESWLDQANDGAAVLKECVQYTLQAPLVSYECSTYGNSTRVEGRECISPVMKQQSLFD